VDLPSLLQESLATATVSLFGHQGANLAVSQSQFVFTTNKVLSPLELLPSVASPFATA